MINHFRTLLMNVDGSAPLPEYLAEEVVDPEFKALDLPTPVDQVRRVLFGSDPDRHMLNVRCSQLLALVHATPLSEHVYKFDPRVTYDFRRPDLVTAQAWTPRVARVAGSGTLSVLSDPAPPDGTGRVHHAYLVTTDAPAVATVERLTRPVSKVDFDFAPNDRVPLGGSGCDCRLGSAATGQAFKVDIYGRPRKDLGQLCAAASNLGEPVYNFLFGVTRAEPFQTFRNLFFRKLELPLRLSALVCALVYRSEEARRG